MANSDYFVGMGCVSVRRNADIINALCAYVERCTLSCNLQIMRFGTASAGNNQKIQSYIQHRR